MRDVFVAHVCTFTTRNKELSLMTNLYISVFLHGGRGGLCYHRANLWKSYGGWTKYKNLLPGGTTRGHVLIVSCKVQCLNALDGSKGERCNVSTTRSQSKLQKVLLSLLAGHLSWIFKVKKTCLSFGGKAASKEKTQIQQHTAFSYLLCLWSAGNLVFFSLFFKAVATCPGAHLVSLCGVFMFDVALYVCFIPKIYKKFVLTIGQLP